ncbi:MAG: AbrB family transcriptional regulator [Clostridiales bacterium 59_14]|nr:MAG: AbrB family transcriptional regulator [Clostridiales bacterium 59_14]
MLAENLALLRNLRGMTQEEVAEVIGISRQSYSKWEQGETIPDIEKCDRLAKFYGVAAPVGKHLWGTVAMGAKGQIVIPKAARDTFHLSEGDRLVVLGDEEQGIALIKAEVFEERMQEALRAGQKSNE